MSSPLRYQFPILQESANGHPLVWLDNAATTQKPRAVINAVSSYYENANANVHRATHALSAKATHQFEEAREKVRQFINAESASEIIWTRGATEALNLLAMSWGTTHLQEGDEILLSTMEHHANIVPWQQVAQQTGAVIKVIPLNDKGELDLGEFKNLLSRQTKILSVTHVSNALGTINPVKDMVAHARKMGAKTIIDGSQAVAHFPVDVRDINCDFYVFSGHKVYGPTGIGVLYGRHELLAEMPPWQTGGEMIERVSFSGTTFNRPPFRFEAGTPNIAGVIGMAAAIDFLMEQNRSSLMQHEQLLRVRLENGLDRIPGLHRIGTSSKKTAVVSFVVDGIHGQDIGTMLDKRGIAVRTGHHCAMPLMEALGLSGTVRASLGCYNSIDDVDQIVSALKEIVEELGRERDYGKEIYTEGWETELPDLYATAPLYNPQYLSSLRDTLLTHKNWQDRYRSIMQLAWDLPKLPDEMRVDDMRLSGCESTVWMYHHYNASEDTLHFAIDSDARIIRGLIVIVMSMLNGRKPAELVNCDVEQLFGELELSNHLSPSRGNGLRAIVQEIRNIAHLYIHT
ncbi:SufS family cysteine desulfurase [Sansalvadorimonas sp. 2012CJ34-2]|uniref:cysteine desulfurase n=1 Tax=Parendozoicomonas callyspongiae TaxID=2942213 RepID=A0ABT0PJ00_9GAMM|nr:SufS family cysteine desulfurase [Sansalvadorimonas sp. 2012CJ34-2]MCL6271370.1 SufS family cysteine desulfurase [Sansalvadorimonas sp. 2012CJ34-2]